LCSVWGLKVATDKVETLARGVISERDQIREMLLEAGLLKTKKVKKTGLIKYTRDTKAAGARMLDACGWQVSGSYVNEDGKAVPVYSPIDPSDPETLPLKYTAKGGICLNEEACEDTWDPVLESYAKYTALENVLGKDVKKLITGEIHGEFDSLVASGRTSCRGFNTQNLRRKGGTRECFVPRDGYDFCLIDLDTAELRAFAQVCLSWGIGSRMAEVMNAGRDVHCELGSELANIDYATFLAGKDSVYYDYRQTAKNSNFGLIGGMRSKRFTSLVLSGLKTKFYEIKHDQRLSSSDREQALARVQVLISQTTVEHMTHVREVWARTWPEAPIYLALIEKLCRRGQLATMQQLWSNRLRGGLRYSEAANTMFQGLIADAIKAAGWEIAKRMYDARHKSVLFGSRIVNVPHDEIIAEVPTAIAHECAEEVRKLFLGVVGRYLPDVPPRATPVLARYWSKSAFPVKDASGRLIPWNGEKK
jgi:hypothetical protein